MSQLSLGIKQKPLRFSTVYLRGGPPELAGYTKLVQRDSQNALPYEYTFSVEDGQSVYLVTYVRKTCDTHEVFVETRRHLPVYDYSHMRTVIMRH